MDRRFGSAGGGSGLRMPMLVRGRLVATGVGVAVIITGAQTGLGIGAAAVTSPLNPGAVARLVVVGLLFGTALSAAAAIVVALVRRPGAVTVMLSECWVEITTV